MEDKNIRLKNNIAPAQKESGRLREQPIWHPARKAHGKLKYTSQKDTERKD